MFLSAVTLVAADVLLVAVSQMLIEDIQQPFGLHSISVDGILNPRLEVSRGSLEIERRPSGPLQKKDSEAGSKNQKKISKEQVSSAEHSGRNVQSLHQ